jgi:hypothetical protein
VADEFDYLEAALRWDSGDRGRSLALLYGLRRRSPALAGVAESAAACSGELGSGPPLLDALPPPLPFALTSAAAALGALFLFLASRSKRREGRREGEGRGAAHRARLKALALLLVLASVVLAILAGAALSERRTVYAVLWTDSLLLVPSPVAEGRVTVTRGTAARVRGETSGYVGLVLADGLAGWAPRDAVYYY